MTAISIGYLFAAPFPNRDAANAPRILINTFLLKANIIGQIKFRIEIEFHVIQFTIFEYTS